MILHLSAKRDQAYFITFPRDTWVSIPGRGTNRINAAYALGGPKLAVSTLEKLTDTRMDHAARVDFQGFAKLTDEVGGVTVYNKTAFTAHGFDYPAGNIRLSGERAIYFVGERRQLPRYRRPNIGARGAGADRRAVRSCGVRGSRWPRIPAQGRSGCAAGRDFRAGFGRRQSGDRDDKIAGPPASGRAGAGVPRAFRRIPDGGGAECPLRRGWQPAADDRLSGRDGDGAGPRAARRSDAAHLGRTRAGDFRRRRASRRHKARRGSAPSGSGADSDFIVTEIEDGLVRRITARQIARTPPSPWLPSGFGPAAAQEAVAGKPHVLFLDLPSRSG